MALISWSTLQREAFEELAEALLLRDREEKGLIARAIDGRGGDGGIDIDVRAKKTHQLIEILQLKHFPEGFSSGFRPRRRQIRDSFQSVLAGRPAVWTLVCPCKITIEERKFLHQLGRGHMKFTARVPQDDAMRLVREA